MAQASVFNSLEQPIPALRPDLEVIPVEFDGDSYLYFHDMLGYAPSNFAIKRDSSTLLSLLDGSRSVNDILDLVQANGNARVSDEQARELLRQIQFLDEKCLLASERYRNYAEQTETAFEGSEVREPRLAGESYPADPEEIRARFSEAYNKHVTGVEGESGASGNIKAIFAPHIDLRVSMKTYMQAFASLGQMKKPDRVILLGTSHYAGLYPGYYEQTPFIVSEKNFNTPWGAFRPDQEIIEELKRHKEEAGVSFYDRAHRIEHSLEIHLLFLGYFLGTGIPVTPILVNSLEEVLYKSDGFQGAQTQKLGRVIKDKLGSFENTLFLISGDLSHVGKKFGDEQPARSMFEEVHQFDHELLERAKEGSASGLLEVMRKNMDAYRICGFAPLYSYFQIDPDREGSVTSYETWDEAERESGVTFGSITFE